MHVEKTTLLLIGALALVPSNANRSHPAFRKVTTWDKHPCVLPNRDVIRGLWHEILTDTGNDPHTPLPRILFKDHASKDPQENCSAYTGRVKKECEQDNKKTVDSITLGMEFYPPATIALYTAAIRLTMRGLAHEYRPMTAERRKMVATFPACILAHEMLHVALDLHNVNGMDQHRIMRDDHYFIHALVYLSRRLDLPPDGIHVRESMDDLNYSVELDRITLRRRQRKAGH